ALFGAEMVGIAFCDRETVREANDAFLDLMGYSREALDAGGFRWRETAPDDRYLDERGLRELIATGRCTPFEKEHLRVDGSDVTQDPRYGQTAPHFGMPRGHLPLRSYLAVPVIARTGAVHGALLLGHPETGTFTERDERIVVELARHAAVALDNTGRHSELENALREEQLARTAASERARLEALGAEVGMALTLPEDRRAVLERCAEAMVRHLDAGLA